MKNTQRVCFLLVAMIAMAGIAVAQDDLLSGEEGGIPWSRYTPPSPEELPPGAKVHTIVKGDTLWDIAESYLGDPYFWPQVWEANAYIGDPHWIYPGDPLVIPQPMLISEVVPEDLDDFDFDTLPPPQPVAKRYDVYCAPYIVLKRDPDAGEDDLEPTYDEARRWLTTWEEDNATASGNVFGEGNTAASTGSRSASDDAEEVELIAPIIEAAPAIVATETKQITIADDDVAFVNRGEVHGVTAGDEFMVVRPSSTVYKPGTRKVIGVAMQMVGTLKVLCTQERTATVMVSSSCVAMEAGDLIRPFEPIPIPLASEFVPSSARCETVSDRPSGQIVYAKENKVTLATEDLVNIDMGTEAGLVPGDFLVIYRANKSGPQFPNTVLGDLVVLMVEKTTATAKVMYTRYDMTVGDQVRLR